MFKAALLAPFSLILSVAASAATTGPAAPPAVAIGAGRVTGVLKDDVTTFLGIPYAAAPTGDRRWAPPAPPPAWKPSVREATRFGPSCPQKLNPDGFMMWTPEYMTPAGPGMSEDCLSLNIWVPRQRAKARHAPLPVLLFIHGGAFVEGAASVPIYDGVNLARQGIVVVTINYRLGGLGFLAHRSLSKEQGGASGNYGIQDQIAALKWLSTNIAAFGGDPTKVTISGQSAGAWSVLALLHAPEAKGLFRGGIVMGAPGLPPGVPLNEAEARGAAELSKWGAADIAQARALASEKVGPVPPDTALTVDGKVITGPNLPVADPVPIMFGYTANDLLIQPRAFTTVEWAKEAQDRYGMRAREFLRYYPGRTDAEATRSATLEAGARLQAEPFLDWFGKIAADVPVFVYRFSHVGAGENARTHGAFHSSEVPYFFDNLAVSPHQARPTSSDGTVARVFSAAVVRFVKYGDPSNGGGPRWTPLTTENKFLMDFGDIQKPTRLFPDGADDVIASGKPPVSFLAPP